MILLPLDGDFNYLVFALKTEFLDRKNKRREDDLIIVGRSKKEEFRTTLIFR